MLSYKGSSILELDSFFNFISQARLRVSLKLLEILVLGNKGSSILELDSFLNFISQARLRVSPLIIRDTSVEL